MSDTPVAVRRSAVRMTAPLTVPCRLCGAATGQGCVTTTTGKPGRTHMQRLYDSGAAPIIRNVNGEPERHAMSRRWAGQAEPPTPAERFRADLAAHPDDPIADAVDRALTTIEDHPAEPDPRHLVTLTGTRIECVAYCIGTTAHVAEYRALDVQSG